MEHHGIVVERRPGELTVIQRDGRPGTPHGVFETDLAGFAREAGVGAIRQVPGRTRSREAVQRDAISHVGEPGFNLLTNNCEDFAYGIDRGSNHSPQARRLARLAGAAVAGPFGYMAVSLAQRRR
jgi:hypothetical protein